MLNGFKNGMKMANYAIVMKNANNDRSILMAGIMIGLILQYHK
jgi:hypothetical protein